MTTTVFFLPDTSPLFAYSAGWVPAYHATENGCDETLHQTSSGTETVSFNLTASSLHFSTPHSDATPPICDVQYRVNGSEWTNGCDVKDMPRGWHTVDIRPQSNGGLQFLGVRGELRLGSDSQYHNTTIDNLSPTFSYSGNPPAWTLIDSAGPLGTVQNQTAASIFGDKGGCYNQSLGMSTASGAKVELTFKGEAVYLYGLSGPEMGMGDMVLDGQTVSRVNTKLPWRGYSSLLFMAGDLDGSIEHKLSYTNMLAGQIAVIDYAIVTSVGSLKPRINLGLILGSAAGGVVFILILIVCLYCFLSRRRTAHRRSAAAGGVGMKSKPGSKSGSGSTTYSDTPHSIDKWRQLSNGAGSPISPVSITFTDASEGTKSTAQLIHLRAAPPDYRGSGSYSEYADYIPYNGPIEPRPAAPAVIPAVQTSPVSLSEGLGSGASWLRTQTESGPDTGHSPGRRSLLSSVSDSARSSASPYTSTSRPTASPSTSAASRPSPPIRTGSRETVSTLDVPFTANDYYSRRDHVRTATASPSDVRMTGTDLFSVSSETPTPTPARRMRDRDSTVPPSSTGSDMDSVQNAKIGTFVSSRVEGSQSVARVWSRSPLDNPDSSPSSGGASMSRGSPIRDQNMQTRHPNGRIPPHLAHIPSTGGFSNLYAAYGGTTSAVPSTAQSLTSSSHQLPSAIPSSAALPTPYSQPSPSMRRGPSIKSVRTARSFFSGLMARGDAPAVPRWDGASRPDSDLFGDSVSVKRRPSGHAGESHGGYQREIGGSTGAGQGGNGRHAPQPLRLIHDQGGSGDSRNMFIELDPNSPMTVVSRPGSEQPRW